ncbi:MAG: HPF/RaiA family ribosome-associated protein [Terracidiphilus sp.]|jgi:putative sigma-54 modulation protein
MEVEYTARKVRISRDLRTLAEEGMERIALILGKSACASIVFSAQKRLQIVEVTIQARLHTIVAEGKAESLQSALRQAIAHAESQARRHRDRRMAIKRKPQQEKALAKPSAVLPKGRTAQPVEDDTEENPVRAGKKLRAAIAVHSFPARKAVVEPRIVTSGDAFALKPMTMEEAVKDAEFRDRDLLIFHNPAGELFVLHRRRDGQLELVEIP